MQRRQVEWSARARRDQREIYRWIEKDRPSAAEEVNTRLREAASLLGGFGHLGRPGRVDGTRELVVGGTDYILAYKLSETRVEVLRVIHGARRWPEKL